VTPRFTTGWTGEAAQGPETKADSPSLGHGGIVTATADTDSVAEARNWNCVPTGMVRQTPGASATTGVRSSD